MSVSCRGLASRAVLARLLGDFCSRFREPIGLCRTLPDMDTDLDDAAEWALAVTGGGDAFGRIFDRHRARVLRHSYRLVSIASDAEDVVAIVFLEAWRKRRSIHFVDGSMLPWLLVTATNAAHNLARSTRRYHRLLRRLPPAALTADHADDFDEGEAQTALRGLHLTDQQVITLCVLEGMSEKEAAAILNIAPGTVKSRLSRAKARLAAHLDPPIRLIPVLAKEAPHE